MHKMRKINGYLVVRFNDRERRDYETLGAYGVIDAELYTGHLEVDRGALEYDDAETMEQAIEQARGLESELDVEEPEAAVTVIVETELGTTELETTPEELLQGEKRFLETRRPALNDCIVYRNTFRMARELDGAIDGMDPDSYPALTLRSELRKLLADLQEMYSENYAVCKYRGVCSPDQAVRKQRQHLGDTREKVERTVNSGAEGGGAS